eukprot:4862187-Pleurochrysis_carterae.AAC.1
MVLAERAKHALQACNACARAALRASFASCVDVTHAHVPVQVSMGRSADLRVRRRACVIAAVRLRAYTAACACAWSARAVQTCVRVLSEGRL